MLIADTYRKNTISHFDSPFWSIKKMSAISSVSVSVCLSDCLSVCLSVCLSRSPFSPFISLILSPYFRTFFFLKSIVSFCYVFLFQNPEHLWDPLSCNICSNQISKIQPFSQFSCPQTGQIQCQRDLFSYPLITLWDCLRRLKLVLPSLNIRAMHISLIFFLSLCFPLIVPLFCLFLSLHHLCFAKPIFL